MTNHQDIERIYDAWDDALGRKDLEAAMALYTDDAVLQSPLICHLLHAERGIVEGKAALREFVALVFDRTPPSRRRHRSVLFTDGQHAVWEYPRETPEGEQLDLVECMDIRAGLISHHRVYWGWLGVKTLAADGYRPDA